jgi:hypothetical protein
MGELWTLEADYGNGDEDGGGDVWVGLFFRGSDFD